MKKRLNLFTAMLAVLVVVALAGPLLSRILVGEVTKASFTLRPQALTATTNGSAVDRLNYQSMLAVLETGTVTGTSPTMDCVVQESDASGSGFAAISPAVTFTQVTTSNNSQSKSVDLLGKKRYMRGVCTIAGTSPSFTSSYIFILGEPGVVPLP